MTAVEAFAEAISGISADSLGDEVADAARRRIFDTIGATAVGLQTEDGVALTRMTAGLAGGGRLPGTDAIRLYTAATRATEIDDINIASCTTVGSVIVPVAAVAAEMHEDAADGRDLLGAVVVGYEAMIRLGTAVDGANALYRGVWPTYVTAPFASAAVTARLLQLDTKQTAHALAIALTRTTALQGRAFRGLSPRWYLLGCAAVEGVVAAHAAREGIAGDVSVLDAYSRSLGVDVDEGLFLGGLGARPAILDVDTKLFPTSRQGLASVQAFREQLSRDEPAEAIRSVDVFVPAQYRGMLERVQMPTSRVDSLVSVAYQVALAALDPSGLLDALRSQLREDDVFRSFVAKVTVHEDARLTAVFPGQWGGRVRVRWGSGVETELEIVEPDGSALRAPGWEALHAKLDAILTASDLNRVLDTGALREACQSLGAAGSRSTDRLLAQLELLGKRVDAR